jgi:hypothetical protein
MNDSKLAGKLKVQIKRFSNRLTEELTKPQRRFITEMLFGIQASKDVKISNISRSLNELIPLIKTENRLCRNLSSADFSCYLNEKLGEQASQVLTDGVVLAVDLGDICKPFAKKMENLALVYDGSKGKVRKGYCLCQIVAAHPHSDHIVPVYGDLFSTEAEGFLSQNITLREAIFSAWETSHRRGIVAIDRGGDRREILTPLLDRGVRFVIRMRGDRKVLLNGEESISMSEVAAACLLDTQRAVTISRNERLKTFNLRVGFVPVRLRERPDQWVNLVVIEGFGERPVLLLTNVTVASRDSFGSWILEIYLTRWKCEETYRLLKQSYQLEDVRVRGYYALKNIYALVNLVMFFLCVVIGSRQKMRMVYTSLCEQARRFFEVGPFFHYALADGIYRLLFRSRTGLQQKKVTLPRYQLVLNL